MAKKKNNRKKSPQKKAQQPVRQKQSLSWVIAAVCVVVIVILAVILWPKGEKTQQPADTSTTNTETVDSTEAPEGATQEQEPVMEDPAVITPEQAQQEARDKLEADVLYYADIDIEDYGTITVQLEPDVAPITVLNFVELAESGFYDGLTFHRIVSGFMMQGGDPLGNGTGGSDMEIEGEFANNGFTNDLSHTRGAISMARSMDYNSASSQFFIVHQDSTFLDGDYAVFGYVTEGMDVVDAVCEAAQPTDGNGTISADQQPVIRTISIRTEPIA